MSICSILPIPATNVPNPFEAYILPLAYKDSGLLSAILGLSACHLALQERQRSSPLATLALEYRLTALQSLGALLLKEEVYGLNDQEEEITLATVLTLVLHDVSSQVILRLSC